MSTRSSIGVETPAGIFAIYCHWDGYPEHPGVGHKLLKYYPTYEKATKLICLGNLSSLEETLDATRLCIHRPEPGNHYSTIEEFQQNNAYGGIEFWYLFKDGKWLVTYLEWKDTSFWITKDLEKVIDSEQKIGLNF